MDRVRVGSSFLLYLGINFLFVLNSVIEICFLEVNINILYVFNFLKKNYVFCIVKLYRFCDIIVVRNKVIV